MVYCDMCAARRNWPSRPKADQLYAKCEICRQAAKCNVVPTAELPAPQVAGPTDLTKNDRRTATRPCLSCGHGLNAVGPLDKNYRAPRSGDCTVCGFCGAIMMLADDLTVRGLTADEISKMKADPDLMAQLALASYAIHFVLAQDLEKPSNQKPSSSDQS